MYKTNVFCKPLQWGWCYNKYGGLWGDQEASGVGYIIERYSSNGAGQALKFTTLLDLASGVGANLRTLSTRIPGPHYFGTSSYIIRIHLTSNPDRAPSPRFAAPRRAAPRLTYVLYPPSGPTSRR